MATLRDIKRRITSVQNTQQITHAMRLVSAAKLNRAQHNARAAQPYAHMLRHMVTTLSRGMTGEDHPMFEVREEGETAVFLFSADRGLCGSFNSQLFRYLQRMTNEGILPAEPELTIIGRVARDHYHRRRANVADSVAQVTLVEKQQWLRERMQQAVQRFASGELARVYLAYNRFVNTMRQDSTLVQLLPIEPPADEEQGERAVPPDEREPIFEPSREGILQSLLPRYVQNQAFLALLSTEAGEHAARMVAMEGATRNAEEMISKLTMQYNRTRQAAITRELIEIVNGAQAL